MMGGMNILTWLVMTHFVMLYLFFLCEEKSNQGENAQGLPAHPLTGASENKL